MAEVYFGLFTFSECVNVINYDCQMFDLTLGYVFYPPPRPQTFEVDQNLLIKVVLKPKCILVQVQLELF